MSQTYTVNTLDSNGRLRNQSIIPYIKPELKSVKTNSSNNPKWLNTRRKDFLVKLWFKYGNKCLLGHENCYIREHYIHDYSKHVLVPYSKSVPCIDTSGNPIKDTSGNPLYVTIYPLRKDILHDKRVRQIDVDGITHLANLYDLKSESIIKQWISEDKSQSHADYKFETETRHKTNDRSFPLHGKFSGISKDIYYTNQPIFYLETLGISVLTFKPFAKLRLASSNIRLFIDISDVLKPLSKNKRHKIMRYGKLNRNLQNALDSYCRLAVNDFMKNKN